MNSSNSTNPDKLLKRSGSSEFQAIPDRLSELQTTARHHLHTMQTRYGEVALPLQSAAPVEAVESPRPLAEVRTRPAVEELKVGEQLVTRTEQDDRTAQARQAVEDALGGSHELGLSA